MLKLQPVTDDHSKTIKDLAMIVRRLVRKLEKLILEIIYVSVLLII